MDKFRAKREKRQQEDRQKFDELTEEKKTLEKILVYQVSSEDVQASDDIKDLIADTDERLKGLEKSLKAPYDGAKRRAQAMSQAPVVTQAPVLRGPAQPDAAQPGPAEGTAAQRALAPPGPVQGVPTQPVSSQRVSETMDLTKDNIPNPSKRQRSESPFASRPDMSRPRAWRGAPPVSGQGAPSPFASRPSMNEPRASRAPPPHARRQKYRPRWEWQ
ncbi:hypothetical protein NU219Hw_g3533t1 [Hortaea werneckii]